MSENKIVSTYKRDIERYGTIEYANKLPLYVCVYGSSEQNEFLREQLDYVVAGCTDLYVLVDNIEPLAAGAFVKP